MTTDGTSTTAGGRVPGSSATAREAALGSDIIRVLASDGRVVDKTREPSLTDDQLLDLYRALVRARVFDEVAQTHYEDRRIGFHASSWGEEAAVVGSAFALRAQDWVFPGQRELGGALLRGMSAEQYADRLFGNSDDVLKGRQTPDRWNHRGARFAGVGGRTGARLTHATGFAWAAKLRGDELVVLACFGDAAIDSGGFHDAMNFAGVFKAPVVLLCRNASAAPLPDVGIAYAVPSVRCDGNDLLAVIDTTRAAVVSALAGRGATLIEAMTTRLDPRAPSDLDPILRVRQYMAHRSRWSDGDDAGLWADLRAEANQAFERAGGKPPPALETMFDDVYREAPARLEEQREELSTGGRYRE